MSWSASRTGGYRGVRLVELASPGAEWPRAEVGQLGQLGHHWRAAPLLDYLDYLDHLDRLGHLVCRSTVEQMGYNHSRDSLLIVQAGKVS